jgi:hypothetical protein
VEAAELIHRHVVFAGVDAGVEIAEGLRHRLDPLVGDPGGGVEGFRLLDVSGFDRGHERRRLRDQHVAVLLEVPAVPGDRRFDLGARLRSGATGHGQEAVFFGAAVAAQGVFARLQGQREAAGDAFGEVLNLAEDRVSVEHLELGHL